MKPTRPRPFLMLALLCAAVAGCGKSEKPVPGTAPAPAATAVPVSLTETIAIDDMLVDVTHPKFDSGQIRDLFDGKRETLARTENATTAVIDIAFQGTRKAAGVDVITGTMDVGLKVTLTLADKAEPLVFSKTMLHQTTEPTVSLEFGGVQAFKRAKVEVTNLNGGDGHIHIYEVKFK